MTEILIIVYLGITLYLTFPLKKQGGHRMPWYLAFVIMLFWPLLIPLMFYIDYQDRHSI